VQAGTRFCRFNINIVSREVMTSRSRFASRFFIPETLDQDTKQVSEVERRGKKKCKLER